MSGKLITGKFGLEAGAAAADGAAVNTATVETTGECGTGRVSHSNVSTLNEFDVEVEALMRRHGVQAYVVAAELDEKLIAWSRYTADTRAVEQHSQFILSAVCQDQADKLRNLALGRSIDG